MRWLVVGGIAAFVAIIVLWRLTRDLTQPITPEPITQERAPQPRRETIEPPVVRIPGAPGVDRPSEPSVPPEANPDVEKQMRGAFRKQVVSIDPYASECIARANNRGAKPSGKASFTVVMAFDAAKGRVRVTEVGIEPGNTNIEDVLLLDCLRDAGKKMQLGELPEGVTSIRATHEISLDAGAITDHKLSAMTMLPVGVYPP